MPPENRISASRLMDAQAALAAFFSAALSVLIYGWSYSSDPNTAQIIPFIKKLMNPALYPGDFYINSQGAFPCVYPWLMAKLAGIFPLAGLHFALYLVLKLVFMRLIYELALELFERRSVALTACFLTAASPLANIFTLLGEDPLLKAAMFQTSVAGPLALLGILLLLRGRNFAAALTLWMMFFINGLLANFTAALYFALFIACRERRRALLKAGLFFIALMVPWALWYTGHKNPYGPASPDFVRLLRLWYPGHYFPLSWGADKWRGIVIFMPLFGYFYYKGLASCRRRMEAKNFLWTFGILWTAGFIFAEILPVRQLIVLQLLRSDALFIGIGMIFAAAFAVRLAEEGGRGTALAGLLFCALFELSGPYNSPYVLYSLYIAALFFADRLMPKITPILAAVVALYALAMGFKFPIQWAQAGAVLFFAVCYLLNRDFNIPLPRRLAAACVIAVLPFAPLPLEHLRNGLEFNDPAIHGWLEIQNWAKANSAAGTVFLTPPEQFGFRVFSERSPVVEWLDAAAMHWAPGAETLWINRLKDIAAAHDAKPGQMPAFMLNDIGYSELDAKGYRALCQKYGASYFIVRTEHELAPLQPVFKNDVFAVYRAVKYGKDI